jgi:hypothetical protein
MIRPIVGVRNMMRLANVQMPLGTTDQLGSGSTPLPGHNEKPCKVLRPTFRRGNRKTGEF